MDMTDKIWCNAERRTYRANPNSKGYKMPPERTEYTRSDTTTELADALEHIIGMIDNGQADDIDTRVYEAALKKVGR